MNKVNQNYLLIHNKRENITRQLKPNSVGLVLEDPPFGVREEHWDNRELFINRVGGWLDEALRISEHTVIWFCAGKMIPYIMDNLIKTDRHDYFFRLHHWRKPAGTQLAGASNNNLFYSNEPILVFSKDPDKTKTFGKDMPFGLDDFTYPTVPYNKFGHPTSKPVPMIRKLMGHYSAPKDVIFDGFAGSFSTAIACLDMGRRAMCVEQSPLSDKPITDPFQDPKGGNPDYYSYGVKRVEKHAAEPLLFTGASDPDLDTEIYKIQEELFEN